MKTNNRLFVVLSVSIIFACLISSCEQVLAGLNGNDGNTEALERPVISPSGGRFSDASVVLSMSCPTSGALVFYTDDGSTPTEASNRYIQPFRLFGATVVVKAIALKDGEFSAVTTATFTLNDGKSSDALGIVKGYIKLSDADAGIPLESFNIFSDQVPGVVKKPDATGFFVFDGLDTTQEYTFYFTNQEVGPMRDTRRIAPIVTEETIARALTMPAGTINTIAKQLANVKPVAGAGLNLGEILLKKCGKIVGKAQMYLRDGSLAADHTGIDIYVPGTSFFGKTDSAGNFALWFVPEGDYRIRAEKAGYTYKEIDMVRVVADTETDISSDVMTIYFGQGIVIGTALLSDANASASGSEGIQLLLKHDTDQSITYTSLTDGDGVFAFMAAEPGTYTLLVTKAGYLSGQVESITVSAGKTTTVPALFLQVIGGTIQGSARLSGETDHAGILVLAENMTLTKVYTGSTNIAGAFAFANVAPGTYRLTASKAGYVPELVSGIALNMGATYSDAIIPSLRPESGTISGTVFLAGTTSHEGILVNARHTTLSDVAYTATTDSAGLFAIVGVKPGNYTLQYSKANYYSNSSKIAVVTAGQAASISAVTLASSIIPPGGLAGRVFLSRDTNHAGIAVLATNSSDPTTTYSTVAGSDGVYAMSNLVPGSYALTMSKSDYKTDVSKTVTIVSGSTATIADVTLAYALVPPGTITGRCLLSGAANHAGITVTARDTADPTLTLTTTTDATGAFLIAGVKPGQYIVLFDKTDYLSANSQILTVASEATVQVATVTLVTALAGLNGRVTLESAADHSGITVMAMLEGTATTWTTTTIADGSYAFAALSAGTYRVQASRNGYATMLSAPFSLSQGGNVTAGAMELAVSLRSIIGKAMLEGRVNHAGIKVTATDLDHPTSIYSALTNTEGVFALAGLVPGSYLVAFSYEGFISRVNSSVSLEVDSMVMLGDVQLPVARGSIEGIASLQGRTNHSGIKVTLPGTVYETTSGASGVYSFLIPAGNYPGGVRFEKADFQTTADTETITVLAESTYGIPSHALSATHNTVRGVIDLLGSEDSGIIVSLDGTSFTMTTSADGSWSFDHVPLGTYSVRFVRDMTPDVVTTVSVEAAPEINLGSLDMIPNSAGLRGYIKLNGMNDHSGVRVTVTNEGQASASSTTNSSGAFDVGNILATGSHTVTASKAGWNGWTTTLSDFTPLETRTIGLSPEIILIDTTIPIITAVTLNEGSLYTSETVVRVTLALTEQGSGPSQMQVRLNGLPAEPNWETYLGQFTRDLSSFYAYTGNGAYALAVRIKDRAGNLSSWTEDSITVTDQLTTIYGPLNETNFHWTKAKSPYQVVGSIRVGVGETLTIDPGVEVRFAGDYYIESYGTVDALGTEAEPILFVKDAAYAGSWSQVFIFKDEAPVASCDAEGNWLSGSRFLHVKANEADNAFSGTGNRCYIADSQSRLNNGISSIQVRSKVDGPASGILIGCEITRALPSGTISDSTIHDVYLSGGSSGNLTDSVLYSIWNQVAFNGSIENVLVDTAHDLGFNGTIAGMTVRNARNVSLNGTISGSRFETVSGNIAFGSTSTTVSGSTFTDYGMLVSNAVWSPGAPSIALNGNYFGPAATEEMNIQGTAVNKSFTHDYWDDITKAELVVSGYLANSPTNVGYQGSAYIGPDVRDTINDTMVFVQGGSSADIPNGTHNSVWSVSSFEIEKYEVTQAQYIAVMGSNPSHFQGDLNRPVEQVSWYNAVTFCNQLSLHEGIMPAYTIDVNNVTCNWNASGYRLPTTAEWEWAARGGVASFGNLYSGSNIVEEVAWMITNSNGTTHPVGKKAPNELGLFDMSGNVFEWCWDWYGGSLSGLDPIGPEVGSYRVIRGGDVNNPSEICLSVIQGYYNPSGRTDGVGFRVARSLGQ